MRLTNLGKWGFIGLRGLVVDFAKYTGRRAYRFMSGFVGVVRSAWARIFLGEHMSGCGGSLLIEVVLSVRIVGRAKGTVVSAFCPSLSLIGDSLTRSKWLVVGQAIFYTVRFCC